MSGGRLFLLIEQTSLATECLRLAVASAEAVRYINIRSCGAAAVPAD